ncbi:MAG: Holliday junction resolvase-like protein [Petrotogales bacterium]
MTFWIFLIGILVGLIFGITLLHRVAISPLHNKIEKLSTEKRLTKIPEHLAKQMQNYPYSIENFRYIGDPIDGVQFEDDQILFVGFKPDKQNKIKKLVNEKKVKWFEFIKR